VRRNLLGLLLASLATAGTAAPALAARPLQTGLMDGTGVYGGPDSEMAFAKTSEAGARVVRMAVSWADVAPRQPQDATNPGDPVYRFKGLDERVQRATRLGLQPLVYVAREVPEWARVPDGSWRPQAAPYAQLARAMAVRYSGTFEGLPRVRYWQAWNEPNLDFYLKQNGMDGAHYYRDMVNRFAAEVKAVHRSNLVVAGGTAPFSESSTEKWGTPAMAFMAEMLCMTDTRHPRRKCRDRVRFDVWAHNPYTSGSPSHRATKRGDVSLGDLPRMARLLRAAARAGRIVGTSRPRFWVTEFAWDSSPPDPGGVPEEEHARWLSEALYGMWRNGVSLAIWFGVRDAVKPANRDWAETYQSGLWARGDDPSFAGDRPKLALQAFRFPFVALPAGRAVRVWGRVPPDRRGRVTIEQQRGERWRVVARLASDRNGMFDRRLRLRARGALRATVAGELSVPFVPRRTRDRRVNPFGGTQPEPVEPNP
jgi:hypothetical protein